MGASTLSDSKTVAVFDLARPSQSVPQGFPTAPCFDPIFFAPSPPLLTYISWPKGGVRHLSYHPTALVKSLQTRVSSLSLTLPLSLSIIAIFRPFADANRRTMLNANRRTLLNADYAESHFPTLADTKRRALLTTIF